MTASLSIFSISTLLATPYLHDRTLLHEVGCWNGETLFNLYHYARLQGKTINACLGTDIHTAALNIAQATSN
jgi:hypothetical protein